MGELADFAKSEIGKTVLTIAGTLLVTGFGAFIGGAKDIFTDYWRRRRQARYHAMLVAVTLDQLIDDCLAVVSDDGAYDEDGERRPLEAKPTIDWPAQLDWTLISPDLMYRCLLLPGMIKSAIEGAKFIASNIAGPPDYDEYFEEVQFQFSSIGLAAVHILDRFRESHAVLFQDRTALSPQTRFEQKIQSIEKERALEMERRKKFTEQLRANFTL